MSENPRLENNSYFTDVYQVVGMIPKQKTLT